MQTMRKRLVSLLAACGVAATLLVMPTAASSEEGAPAVQKESYAAASYVEGIDYGNLNEDQFVDPVDALLVLQFYVNAEELDENQRLAADVDLNDSIDPVDAMNILQFYVGVIPSLPVGYIPPIQGDINDSPVVLGEFVGDKYYTDLQAADTIYYINCEGISKPEANLLMSLQGIVAKEQA